MTDYYERLKTCANQLLYEEMMRNVTLKSSPPSFKYDTSKSSPPAFKYDTSWIADIPMFGGISKTVVDWWLEQLEHHLLLTMGITSLVLALVLFFLFLACCCCCCSPSSPKRRRRKTSLVATKYGTVKSSRN